MILHLYPPVNKIFAISGAERFHRPASYISYFLRLRYCNKLLELEAGYTEKRLSFRERFLARKERSVPMGEEFFAWAQKEYGRNPVPKSAYGAALT